MNKFKLFISIIVLSHASAIACEMPVYISKFKINHKIKSLPPIKPDFKLVNIIRAVRADTCRFGIGEIELELKTTPKNMQGYSFEVIKGKLDGGFTFGSVPVGNLWNKSKYPLEWKDGNTNIQEPFNVVLKITGISRSGQKSSPQFLKISHGGVKIPWWNIWRQLPYSITQVVEYM